jgi:hypothetical protein
MIIPACLNEPLAIEAPTSLLQPLDVVDRVIGLVDDCPLGRVRHHEVGLDARALEGF